jgi:hypothetical protein
VTRPADFLTIDAFERPPGGNRRWRRQARAALETPPPGLRSATVNHADTGTHSLVPRIPPGSALVLAWDSAEAAADAWRGPLRGLVDGPGRFSLDGRVARARREHDDDTWHGWTPTDEGADPIDAADPVAVVVHGVLRRRHLLGFLRNNLHAASRAAHHPGHRGSVDVSSALPFEHTSISLWKTRELAEDFAYAPGGHAPVVKHARQADTHRTGVFLRLRPLASTGGLGGCDTAYPDLPPANRG